MKQVIRLVLAGLVVLGLAACGASDSGQINLTKD